MIHILIGGLTTAGLILVIQVAKKRGPAMKWWHWLLIILEYAFIIFILEVIVSFFEEGAIKGAVVMGTILGFLALIGAFLLARLIFSRKTT